MTSLNGVKLLGSLLFVMTILSGVPAFGQIAELSGEYGNLNHEDAMERAGGPPLGDYLGLPLNEAGRIRADANLRPVFDGNDSLTMFEMTAYISRHLNKQ